MEIAPANCYEEGFWLALDLVRGFVNISVYLNKLVNNF